MLLVGSVFLLNLNAGWLFEVPDVIPVVGHVDEGLALIAVLTVPRYFGWSIPGVSAATRERSSAGAQSNE